MEGLPEWNAVMGLQSVFVVEIKRKREIGEEVESEVSRKVARLSIRKDKSVRTVLVYDGNLHPIVRSNAYFDALIDIADLMKQGVCPHSYFQTMGRS